MDTIIGIVGGFIAAILFLVFGRKLRGDEAKKDPAAEGRRTREEVLNTDPGVVVSSLDPNTQGTIADAKRDAAQRILDRARAASVHPGGDPGGDNPRGSQPGG